MFTPKIEAQMLARRLIESVEHNDYELISYGVLSVIAGADVTKEMRGCLMTARKIAERETGRLFDCIPRQGIKLLTPQEQASVSDQSMTSLKRLTKRKLWRLERVEFDKLPEEAQTRHSLAASVLGTVALFMRPKSQQKLLGAVTARNGRLAIGDTLRLFSDGNNKKL